MKDLKYLVALHRAMNLTPTRFFKGKAFFEGSWENMWKAKISDFQGADLDTRAIETFFKNKSKVSPEKEIEALERLGAKVLVYGQDGYPEQLKNIPSPPVILFCRGEIRESDFPSISVIGSRKITSYGRRALEKIVGEIADSGVTIVSGLALGTDVLAQKCAVGHGARTISILGNGIDQICPATNRSFGEKVLSENKGAILSEYLPGVDARPEYFPVRNRIVAALSKATIAIEAAEKSGSLITCNLAIDFGKEVFAVPGEIFSPNSKGTNGLILKGVAAPAVSGQQILEYLGLKNIEQQKKAKMNVPEVGIEADILQLFGNEKMHIDDLIRVAKFPGNVVSSTVSILEIKGYVVNLGGQVYAVS